MIGSSLWDRLTAKIIFPTDLDECFGWSGALSLKRRGQKRPIIRDGKRVVGCVRIVCAWYQGPPPTPTHEAGHTCPDGENSVCLNPRHLRWMTRVENEQFKQSQRRETLSPTTPA